jgi:hypothetical protein
LAVLETVSNKYINTPNPTERAVARFYALSLSQFVLVRVTSDAN